MQSMIATYEIENDHEETEVSEEPLDFSGASVGEDR